MTILQLISSEGYYGAESMLVSLGRALNALGCQSMVGVFRDSRSPHTEIADEAGRQGIPVQIIPCNGRCDWSAVRRIRELVGKHSIHVLHPHGYKADMYALAAAWPRRAALVATVHNWPSRLRSMRAYAVLDRILLRRFDRVTTPSEIVAGTLRRSGVAAARVVTIPNGVDLEHFRQTVPTLLNHMNGRRKLVGFVGRLVPDKGGELLLRAAQRVLATYPDSMFVFVGDGPSKREWETLAQQLGIAAHVAFTGRRDDMPGVYASLDLVVLPSLNEAMPMCLLEAMSAAKPVIATRVGSIPKLVIPGVNGMLVEPGDVDGLVSAIAQLLGDSELRRRLGERGHADVAAGFSAQAAARRYLSEYEMAVAGRLGSRRAPVTLQRSRI